MTYVLFIGDMFVMGFMVAAVVWLSLRARREEIDATARIPLEDEAECRADVRADVRETRRG